MIRLFLLLSLLLSAAAAPAEELKLTIGEIPARAWLPPEGTGPAPLVLFSHGFGGCPAQGRFLTGGLAEAGYVVVAPEHDDHACGWPGRPEMPFRVPELWTPKVFHGRLDDMRTVLASLKADPAWAARIDFGHVGIMGHSLGGYTAFGMAGAVPGWETPGIDALLVMSPYCTPFIYRGGLEKVRIPVLIQGGSWDRPITPTVTRPGGCYDLMTGPAWYAGVERAWHLSWTWLAASPRVRQTILTNAVQFFDMTLKGRGAVTPLPGLHLLMRK